MTGDGVRVWIDIANSPHAVLFGPVVKEMRARGWEVLLTARDHAQTVELASRRWPDVRVVGDESPASRLGKATSAAGRARALARVVRPWAPDVALSHGSYSQIIAAWASRIPSVTMMDYEYQPANHISFRLANRVVVPDTFPAAQLKRFGARAAKVVRYAGFKEELYLSGFEPSASVLDELDIDSSKVLVVLRPPPDGALYHRVENTRFDEVVAHCRRRSDVHAILLPRSTAQRKRFAGNGSLAIPSSAPDALSLSAYADVVVGAGGTMNREAALLGAATYTMFAGRLAAVDAELVRLGYMHDLRAEGELPVIASSGGHESRVDPERGRELLRLVLQTAAETARRRS